MITGMYVSNGVGLDGPTKNDTITLMENNTFRSKVWGNGKYDLSYSGKGTKIILHYNYQFGKASYKMEIKRNYYIEPKLVFDYDQNYFFEKIK